MKKIVICCSGGITSRLLARRLQTYCDKHAIDMQFDAVGIAYLQQMDEPCDLIVFAPQTAQEENSFHNRGALQDVPLVVLNGEQYCELDPETVLPVIQKALAKNSAQALPGKERVLFWQRLRDVLNRVAHNQYIQRVVRSISAVSALLICQAVFTLVLSLPLGEAYQHFLNNSGIRTILEIPIYMIPNIICLQLSFCMGYNSGREYPQHQVSFGILSLIGYLLLIPIEYSVSLDPVRRSEMYVSLSYINYTGMFLAILSGLLSGELLNWVFRIAKRRRSSDLYSRTAAYLVIVAVFILIRTLCSLTTKGNAYDLLMGILEKPMSLISESAWGMFLYTLLSCLCWIVGVHGTMLVYTAIAPLWSMISMANMAAFGAGIPAPYSIWRTIPWIFIGGSGATFSLNLLLLVFAKSDRLKNLGKISIVTSVFNINEPIVFGAPVIFNPYLVIPFVSVPLVNYGICYLTMYVLKWIPVPTGAMIDQYLPVGVSAVLTNNSWLGLVLLIALLLLDMLLYYPFFALYDRDLLEKEQASFENPSDDEY